MTRWQQRLWSGAIGLLATVLILLGVMVGLFRIAVQVAPEYRQDLAAWVENLIGSAVAIGNMDLAWRGWYPTLILRDVSIDPSGDAPLVLEELQLGFAVQRMILVDPLPARVVLIGLDLTASLSEDGVRVQGAGGSGGGGSAREVASRLLDIGEVLVRDSSLTWHDQLHQLPPRRLDNINLRAVSRAAGFSVELQELTVDGGRVRGHADFPTLELPPQRLQLDIEGWFPWEDLAGWLPGAVPVRAEVRAVELDAYWRGEAFVAASGRIALRELTTTAGADLGMRELDAVFRAEQRGPSLHADFSELRVVSDSGNWPASVLSVDLRPRDGAHWRIGLNASYLRLDDFYSFAPLLPPAASEALQRLAPGGEIHDLVGYWDTDRPLPVISARLERLSWRGDERIPGVEGLSGRLAHDGDRGRFEVDSEALQFDWPKLFPKALPVARLNALLEWQKHAEGWRLTSQGLGFELLTVAGGGDLALDTGAEAPSIDLRLDVSSTNVLPVLDYQPQFWGAPLRRWLGESILSARVPRGRILVRGPLGQFPWVSGDGLFQVDLDIADLNLQYAAGWPTLDDAALQLKIEGDQLAIDVHGGNIHRSDIERGQARLRLAPRQPLNIKADLRGDARNLFGYVEDSPLRERFADLVRAIDVRGPARVGVDLELPLWNLDRTRFRGDARVSGVTLTTPHWDEPVRNIHGRFRIAEAGLDGKGLSAEMEGQSFDFDLKSDQGWTEIHASADFELARHGPNWDVPSWITDHARGESRVEVEMAFGPGGARPILVRSDLQGTALDVPAPFGKRAEESRPVSLRIETGSPEGVWLISEYAGLLSNRALFAAEGGQLIRTHVRLGGEAAPNPSAPGVWADGEVPELDFEQWYRFLRSVDDEGDSMRFGGLVLTARRVDAFGQLMRDLRIQVTTDGGSWRMSLAGADAQGSITWPRESVDPRGAVSARFGRLHWGWELSEEDTEPTDPRDFPALDLAVDNLILNDQPLGRVNLKLEPLPTGIAIRKVQVGDPEKPEFDLTGDWLRDERGSQGRFDFRMDTRQFRNFLAAFGYEENIRAGRARVNGHLEWPPEPRGLIMDKMSGELGVALADGQILAVEPGAGRMLGLLSFNALPRRFFLDFRDVVDSGLGFDKINGKFQIAEGDAFTEGLRVEGPSLKVESRGRVGLAKRDYDQTVTVYPSISSGVTIAATVLGGPAVGLFTLFAQELFDKPLDQVGQFSYHLGGSWDNPEVSKIP